MPSSSEYYWGVWHPIIRDSNLQFKSDKVTKRDLTELRFEQHINTIYYRANRKLK